MNIQLTLFLALVVACLASNERFFPSHECIRQRSCMSHDFTVLGHANAEESFSLDFAVKLNNVDRLAEILNDVSDPKSANYGKHWTFDQIGELTANLEATQMVVDYLKKFIAEDQIKSTPYGGFVSVDLTIKQAEEILRTRFLNFHSEMADQKVTRTFGFHLPEEIAQVIDYVYPTVQFPPTKAGKPIITVHEANANVSPDTLFSYYNITNPEVTNSGATQSLFESLGQQYSDVDLTSFQNMFGLPKDPVDDVVGENDPDQCLKNANDCAEANLDVQYMMAIAQHAPTTYWSEANSLGDIFYKWIVEVASYPNPPLVHSISYGSIEDELESLTQNRFNQEASKLGAQGVTIVVSSGDDGVANFGARSDSSQCGFHPSYPASVPSVVAVGATKGPESGSPEIACTSDAGGIITTGGGFSTTFSRPSYQDKEVQAYQSNSTVCPPTNLFASSGRGYPDVAMAGYNYQVVIGGSIYALSGTSASAPVFAGVLSLVNNARLNKGKSPVGYVNPALYSVFESTPQVYNDVTQGTNNCCAQNGLRTVCCTYGFGSTTGWDPTTGLGSVNAGYFIDVMANL